MLHFPELFSQKTKALYEKISRSDHVRSFFHVMTLCREFDYRNSHIKPVFVSVCEVNENAHKKNCCGNEF